MQVFENYILDDRMGRGPTVIMSTIFLSYSRADRPRAQIVAEALEAEGLTVWWDKVLKAGQTYDEVTEQMLRDSDVVVVLWSKTSVKSKWVRAEATLGQRTATVIPAMIEDAERPIMFELTQTADLIGWDGDRTNGNWQGFVADIRGVIGASVTPAAAPDIVQAPDTTIEATYWTSIQDSSDPTEFESYLRRYPEGHFRDLARSRLAAMTTAAVAAADPPQAARQPVQTPPAPPAERSESGTSGSRLPLLVGGAVVLASAIGAAVMFLPRGGVAGNALPDTDAAAAVATPNCDICPDMVSIPAGTFLLGSPSDEPGRTGNEGPQTEVLIAGFEMSRTEITQAEWAACVADGPCAEIPGDGESLPAAFVSWDDAHAYTSWLSSKTDRAYRLPTEAEWEYAARAGTTSAYWWGSRFDQGRVMRSQPGEVTALEENPFGLFGMLGNVREWVEDCYVNNYANRAGDGRVVETGNCDLRVVRGGSYELGASEHRAANRARISRDTTSPAIGFRVVVSSGQAN